MAHVLTHTAAVEALASDPRGLPEAVVVALRDDLPYARFGAVLPDLPYYDASARVLLRRLRGGIGPRPPFATLFHNGAPVAFGLRMAELVAHAALVGRSPGIAVVAGYFSHLALDRSLRPPVHELVRTLKRPKEHPRVLGRRIEFLQAIAHLEHRLGRRVLGWGGLSERLRLLKRESFPLRGIGRGLFELVHTASADTVGPAPTKADLDHWVRSLYLLARLLASPLGPRVADVDRGLMRRVYEDEFDFESVYEAALERARHHIGCAHAYLEGGVFDRAARERVFEAIPEGSMD
ncbi:MAG: hypothetical protein D6729_01160 [Deltaproteobacteria bacterium]|nr:MAG: hypothetical protein D6729_01160 [Deltaproteobacteria bacterium]